MKEVVAPIGKFIGITAPFRVNYDLSIQLQNGLTYLIDIDFIY